MKIKDYLETLPENSSGQKGLFGKELKILEPYFENIEELKGKKIEIIKELKTVGEPIVEMTKDGVSFKHETEPKLINVKGTKDLSNNIKVYSIFLQNDDVIVRCTEDSIGFIDIELPPFEDIDDNGNYIGYNPKFL